MNARQSALGAFLLCIFDCWHWQRLLALGRICAARSPADLDEELLIFHHSLHLGKIISGSLYGLCTAFN